MPKNTTTVYPQNQTLNTDILPYQGENKIIGKNYGGRVLSRSSDTTYEHFKRTNDPKDSHLPNSADHRLSRKEVDSRDDKNNDKKRASLIAPSIYDEPRTVYHSLLELESTEHPLIIQQDDSIVVGYEKNVNTIVDKVDKDLNILYTYSKKIAEIFIQYFTNTGKNTLYKKCGESLMTSIINNSVVITPSIIKYIDNLLTNREPISTFTDIKKHENPNFYTAVNNFTMCNFSASNKISLYMKLPKNIKLLNSADINTNGTKFNEPIIKHLFSMSEKNGKVKIRLFDSYNEYLDNYLVITHNLGIGIETAPFGSNYIDKIYSEAGPDRYVLVSGQLWGSLLKISDSKHHPDINILMGKIVNDKIPLSIKNVRDIVFFCKELAPGQKPFVIWASTSKEKKENYKNNRDIKFLFIDKNPGFSKIMSHWITTIYRENFKQVAITGDSDLRTEIEFPNYPVLSEAHQLYSRFFYPKDPEKDAKISINECGNIMKSTPLDYKLTGKESYYKVLIYNIFFQFLIKIHGNKNKIITLLMNAIIKNEIELTGYHIRVIDHILGKNIDTLPMLTFRPTDEYTDFYNVIKQWISVITINKRETTTQTTYKKTIHDVTNAEKDLNAIVSELPFLTKSEMPDFSNLTVIDDVIKDKSELSLISIFKNWLFVKMGRRKPDLERVIFKINKIILSKKYLLEGNEPDLINEKEITVKKLNSHIKYIKDYIENKRLEIEHHKSCYKRWERELHKNIKNAVYWIKENRKNFENIEVKLDEKYKEDVRFKEKDMVSAGKMLIDKKEKLTKKLRYLGIKISALESDLDVLNGYDLSFIEEFKKNYKDLNNLHKNAIEIPNNPSDKERITYMIKLEELEYLTDALLNIKNHVLTPPPIPDPITPDENANPTLKNILTLKRSQNIIDIENHINSLSTQVLVK